MVLGSFLRLANHNQNKPNKEEKTITNNEFAELFTPLGSFSKPNNLLSKLLAAKKWWLNNSGWWIRSILYLFLWTGFAFLIRRNSLASDQSSNLNYYNKSVTISAFFIFVFAITSSTAPWDWFMSIQPHWFSTLWGWYSFISMFVASCAVTMLFVIYLRGKGYLKNVTDEHQHDLGVFMFAFSVAWGYLFFSQFMLIWYSNMPEETSYYKLRIDHYTLLMWACVFMNFITPFLVLMTAGAKRHRKVAAFGAIVIIIGHWLDFFQMSMPAAINEMSHYHSMHAADGAAHHEPHFNHPGFLEIGLGLTLAGIFMLVVFNALSKASLVPKNHPFTKESVIHHV